MCCPQHKRPEQCHSQRGRWPDPLAANAGGLLAVVDSSSSIAAAAAENIIWNGWTGAHGTHTLWRGIMRPVKSSNAYASECCKVLCTDGYCGQRWLFFPCCCLCCCALAMPLYVTSRCCGRVLGRLAAFATAHPILHLFMHQCRHCTRYKHPKRPAGCAGRSMAVVNERPHLLLHPRVQLLHPDFLLQSLRNCSGRPEPGKLC